jgi:hypothetical protein
MKLNRILLAAIFLLPQISLSAEQNKNRTSLKSTWGSPNPFGIRIDNEKTISDPQGFLYIDRILELNVGDSVVFYLSDGTKLTGLVKQRQTENNTLLFIFGQCTNNFNIRFGFAFTNQNVFTGSLVLMKEQKTINVSEVNGKAIFISDLLKNKDLVKK